MVASSIPCKLSLCADRAHACAGDSYVSSAIDVACPTSQSVFAIASPHELHGDSWPSSSTGTRSFCCNHQFSITAITTSTGAISERYAYSAYGQPTILNASGSVISATTLTNRYTYTGREWDATLGLHHFRARWLSPIAGRFLGRDPIGLDPDNNMSRVFNGNPIKWVDPSGLEVPPYDPAEVGNCTILLKQVIAGTSVLQLKPCARELLKLFIYGKGGGTVCPVACEKALDKHDWSKEFKKITPKFANIPCGIGPVTYDFSFQEFASEFTDDDLYWSFKKFTLATMEGACTLSCSPNTCGCCDCSGNCGAVIKVKDDYDFCSSYDPDGTLGSMLAKCGCILEDFYKKRGKPKTFSVNCSVGHKTGIKFGYRKCGDD